MEAYDTGDPVLLDAEEREYNQYQKAHGWMEKSGNIMLSEHIAHPGNMYLWKFNGKSRSTTTGVRIEEWVCRYYVLCVMYWHAMQVSSS
jgi:hypothetical protein